MNGGLLCIYSEVFEIYSYIEAIELELRSNSSKFTNVKLFLRIVFFTNFGL